jgi:hypothetical protein
MTAMQVSSIGTPAFNYSESTDGRFANNGYPNIGTLGEGVNTISGTEAGDPSDGQQYFSTFSVTLPVGMVITSGALTITNFTYNYGSPGALGSNFNGSVTEPLNSSTTISGNGTYNLTANAPYSTPGSFNVNVQPAAVCLGVSGPCAPGSFSYSLQYTVALAGN